MGKKLKQTSLWVRRRSHLPVILIGGLVILVLFFNDDTSISRNLQYQRQINVLKREIAECQDSARYYKEKREAILNGHDDLERIAREQYNMKRPTEDIFLINE